MSAIKKFFEKKKLDAKFKSAGQGHKLISEGGGGGGAAAENRTKGGCTPGQPPPVACNSQPASRALTESQLRAAQAAEARLLHQGQRGSQRPPGTSALAMRVRRELEEEMRLKPLTTTTTTTTGMQQPGAIPNYQQHSPGSQSQHSSSGHSQVSQPSSSMQNNNHHMFGEGSSQSTQSMETGEGAGSSSPPSITGVYYTCPLLGPDVLPRAEIDTRIRDFLQQQYEDEPALTAVLMIQTFNKNRDKVRLCVDTLIKYLDNLIQSPEQEKFRRIRLGNRVFQDRVASVEGARELLQGLGFKLLNMAPAVGGAEEEFYVMDEALAENAAHLLEVREALLSAEPVRPQLDRNIKVYASMGNVAHFDLPDDFYHLTIDEVRKEQKLRTDIVEREQMLRTKAMREREVAPSSKRYLFTLVRVRFPDNLVLQGTFYAHERLAAIYSFVREALVNDWCPFHLAGVTGQRLVEEEKTLTELGLVPAVVINFAWEVDVVNEILAERAAAGMNNTGSLPTSCDQLETLKPEILENIESL